jgi:hypothetical protein
MARRACTAGTKPHNTTAATTLGTANNNSAQRAGTTRASIHAASTNISAPNRRLTLSIQAPARGIQRPAELPTTSSGAPIPRLIANRAAAPRTTSPVWPITISAATSTGPTQVVTIKADNMPITATPPKLPPRWRLLSCAMRVWMKPGICSVKTPNIDSAMATNSAANSMMIHGC